MGKIYEPLTLSQDCSAGRQMRETPLASDDDATMNSTYGVDEGLFCRGGGVHFTRGHRCTVTDCGKPTAH